jgi:uncharacterized protein (TIGR04255 family)
MSRPDDPLIDDPPAEVPLEHAPLVRVIAQVRFPEILSVESREIVAPFQDAIRRTYPVLREERAKHILMDGDSVREVKPQAAWRFSDLDQRWRLTLTPTFLALETTEYTSRSDFFGRFRVALAALDEHVAPTVVERLGVRYIDRVSGPILDEIARLVRPEVRGIVGTPLAAHATHGLSETLFESGDDRVLARWGTMPPGMTFDPAAIEPIAEKSWILDVDMFSTGMAAFSVDSLVATAERYAARVYAFFRWAVTDEFLRRHGAKS